jgi:hypothetical protein
MHSTPRPHWPVSLLLFLALIVGGGAIGSMPRAAAQTPQQTTGNLILSGQINLTPSVYVFAQSSTAFGIYFLNGSDWQLITSIPVSAVTVDSVQAKLSPDGSSVAYLVTDGDTGNSAVYTSNLFGMGTRLLYSSTEPSMAATSFAWYGNDRVAYTLKRGPFAAQASNGTAANPAEQAAISPFAGEVWLSSTDGISQTQIVSQTAGIVLGSTSASSPIYYTAVNTQTEELVGLNSVATDGSVVEILHNQVDTNGQGTIYHSFDLVQTAPGVTKIAAVSASAVGNTIPPGGTRLLTVDLNGGNIQTVLSDTLDIARAVWSPDGTKVAYVRQSTGELSIRDLNNGTTSTLPNAVRSNIQWDASGSQVVTLAALNSDSNPFTKGLSIQSLDGTTIASAETQATANALRTRYLVPAYKEPGYAPYVHQVFDTPANFADKGGSCVATSVVMALANLGKLTAPYGNWVPEFHATETHLIGGYKDPGVETTQLGLSSKGVDNHRVYSFQEIIDALDRNHTVIASTALTGDGHIILIIGYERWSTYDVRLIVNDPYGNNNEPGYGTKRNGAGVVYTWEQIRHNRWGEVWGWQVEIDAVASTDPTPDPTKWWGQYYNNTTMTGPTVMKRNDADINFDWGTGSPSPGVVNADNFSVRWTKEIDLSSHAIYRFATISDDGIRIFVDDLPVLNRWDNHSRLSVETAIYLRAGKHKIKVEYYEAGGSAAAFLYWWMNGASTENWAGSYYNNTTLSGDPVFLRQDPNIGFNWGSGSPGSGVNSDNFSARWTRRLFLPGGAWMFYTSSDDGSRASVDGSNVVSQWWDHGARTEYSGYRYLNAGDHDVTVEFYEHGGGASMVFGYWPQIWAEYYDQPNFRGNYKTAVLNSVDQNWFWGGPHKAWWQTQDNFSTRYTWPVNLRGGDYRICIDSDDGFKFIVDGQVKFQRWYDNNGQTCQTVNIAAGWRTFRIEHYENKGGARIRMTWGRTDGTWYGVAQPASQAAGQVTYITDNQAALAAAIPAQVSTMDEYFQLMHEHGTLGLNLNAIDQTLSHQVALPIIVR